MSDETTPYAENQAKNHAAYAESYRAWVASVSPEDRERLESLGLLEPEDDGPLGGGNSDHDMAEDSRASESFDYAAAIDAPERRAVRAGQPSEEMVEFTWDVMRRLLGELQSQKNVKLAVDCLALASGVAFIGDSQTEVAKRHGVGRAAVSKRCVELTERLGLPPSRAMRPLSARSSYASARFRRVASEESSPQCKHSN